MTIPHERIDKSDEHYTVSLPAYERVVQANTRLLAVARAAKDVYSTGFVQMFHQADGRHFYLVPVDDMEEFRDKLDAVEDLL